MNKKAIGMFDSGIGGLTVYRAIKERMPNEQLIYIGDTARLPFGTKSAETIVRFSEELAQFLIKKKVKIIVVACNSSSSYALPHLQDKMDVPVIGVIEPGAEAAVAFGQKKIGIIGTAATIHSQSYENSIRGKNPRLKIIAKECPLFVPLVEEGWLDHPVTRMVAEEYLLPMVREGIDTLVLGCTHYPVLSDVIRKVIGPDIRLIDSAQTTAEKVGNMLTNLGWLNPSPGPAGDEYYVTDFPERFKRVGEIFLKRKIKEVQVASL